MKYKVIIKEKRIKHCDVVFVDLQSICNVPKNVSDESLRV
jgi:hypothetical protein